MNARVLVTGVDSAGRSCVAHHRAVTYSGDKSTDGLASGAISWMVVEYAPRVAFSMHNTDSVDLDTVLAGSVEITLDDGVHELAVGDCVVVTGVDHAWRARGRLPTQRDVDRSAIAMTVVAIGKGARSIHRSRHQSVAGDVSLIGQHY